MRVREVLGRRLPGSARVRRERAAEEVRRRVDQERLRLARELHDVVAHSIAVINFQAGVAVHVLDRRPGQARAALLAIKQASGEALQELRATLGVLRQLGEQGGSRAPLAGLAQLDGLVACLRTSPSARSAGPGRSTWPPPSATTPVTHTDPSRPWGSPSDETNARRQNARPWVGGRAAWSSRASDERLDPLEGNAW